MEIKVKNVLGKYKEVIITDTNVVIELGFFNKNERKELIAQFQEAIDSLSTPIIGEDSERDPNQDL